MVDETEADHRRPTTASFTLMLREGKMNIINKTPHEITIYARDKRQIIMTLIPEPPIMRVKMIEKEGGNLLVGIRPKMSVYQDAKSDEGVLVPVVSRKYGSVEGIPNKVREDEIFIVSSIVLSALKAQRHPLLGHCVTPDTGDSAIRDSGGNIIGVTRLVVDL